MSCLEARVFANCESNRVELCCEGGLNLDLREFELQASNPLEQQRALQGERSAGRRRLLTGKAPRNPVGRELERRRERRRSGRRLVQCLLQTDLQVPAQLGSIRAEQRHPQRFQLCTQITIVSISTIITNIISKLFNRVIGLG